MGWINEDEETFIAMLNSKFKNDYFKDVKETFNLDIVVKVKNLIKFSLD